MADNNDFPKTFKLAKAGDSAIVRLLHSSVSTIEIVKTHWVQKGDSWKHFKCVGDNCPACASNNAPKERAYIRLFNYGTGEVEVWDRTNNKNFFNSIRDLENDWGALDEIVVKITRDSDDFPTYTVVLQPSKNYPKPENVAIDEKIAYRMVSSRSAEDIKAFLDTGVMPPKAQKNNTDTTNPATMAAPVTTAANGETIHVAPPSNLYSGQFAVNVDEDGDLPF